MSVNQTDVFAIAHHHRFQWEEAQGCFVILFPEGMVKLNGGAGEVLNQTDLIIMTHECQEARMNQVLNTLTSIQSVHGEIVRIRKEELNG